MDAICTSSVQGLLTSTLRIYATPDLKHRQVEIALGQDLSTIVQKWTCRGIGKDVYFLERARNPSPGFSSSIRTLQWCSCIWKYNRHASCKEFGRHSETACLHLSLIRALWKDMGKFGVLMSSKKLLLAKHVVKTLPIRHINFRFAVYERTWSCTEASPRVCMFGCTLVRAALSLLSSLNLWCCRCCCCYDCYFRLAFEYRKKT